MRHQTPPIILITADQLRQDSLSCYGQRAVATPNLDGLAAGGTRFDRAYTVSPWCLPARCSLLTGRRPSSHGADSNFRDVRLSPDIPSLYTELGKAGYHVAHVGKCHYAPVPYAAPKPDRTLPYEDFRDYYVSLGIDQLVLQDDKQVSVWFADDYAKELDRVGHLEAYRGAVWNRQFEKVFPFPGPAEWHPDAWVGRKAADLIERHPASSPLFLWLSFSGPHFPFDPPQEWIDRVDERLVPPTRVVAGEFDDPARIHHPSWHGGPGSVEPGACLRFDDAYWQRLARHYLANVALLDHEVGRVLAAIERRFPASAGGPRPIIIFTADHGEMLGNHGIWGKHNCGYEDVLNIPLIVHDPDDHLRLPRSGTAGEMVMLTDLMPSLCRVVGRPIPAGVDGEPLGPLLARGGHTRVVAEADGFSAVSDGRHKTVRVRRGDIEIVERFDLLRDPGEFHNLGSPDTGLDVDLDSDADRDPATTTSPQ